MRFHLTKRIGRLAAVLVAGLATAGLASAQQLLPPVTTEFPVMTETVPEREMQDASDRALFAPNMFGAVLGTRWFVASGPGLNPGGGGGAGTISHTVSAFVLNKVAAKAMWTGAGGSTTLTLGIGQTPLTYNGVGVPGTNFTSTTPVLGGGQPTLGLVENSAYTAAIQAAFGNPGEAAVYNAAASKAIKPAAATFPLYNIFLVYDFVSGGGLIIVPNPADGGLTGRNRVSTDSSPLPRDRVIFNYDFVSNGALMPGTPTLNRFVVGFEKTFLDGLGSVEVRLPFAATVTSTSGDDGAFGTGHGEIGNLFVVTKVIIYTTETFLASGGLGISIPTADDVRLQFGGPDVLRIRNDAVILTPFIGTLWTPSDRMFAQTWFGCGLDTCGNRVETNLFGKGPKLAGRMYDPTALQIDMQVGYWLVHPTEGTGFVRGLAPFVEAHYNQQLQAQNTVIDGPFTLAPGLGQLSEFDLTAGVATQLGINGNLMLGATFPLTNAQNRFSDWQIGLRLNYFFGPTGRAAGVVLLASNRDRPAYANEVARSFPLPIGDLESRSDASTVARHFSAG